MMSLSQHVKAELMVCICCTLVIFRGNPMRPAVWDMMKGLGWELVDSIGDCAEVQRAILNHSSLPKHNHSFWKMTHLLHD